MMIRQIVFTAFLACTAMPVFADDQKANGATSSEPDDPVGSKLSERLGQYVQTGWFDDVDGKKHEAWKKKYELLTLDEKIRYCIFQLRKETWFETDSFYREKPYSNEPEPTASHELIKIGRPAIPQLLQALTSRISTNIHPTRHRSDPWPVQDAAMNAIQHITCRWFTNEKHSYELSDRDDKERQKLQKKASDWWERNKSVDEVQWAKDALFSEKDIDVASHGLAIESLYYRLGKESYPFLAKAYHRLPKGREDAGPFDETMSTKIEILQRLLQFPTAKEKSVFVSAVKDAPLWVRIDGAEGLFAIGDPSGMEAMAKETEELLLKDFGSSSLSSEYRNLTLFLQRCNKPRSQETIFKCLGGRNPYLRQEAIRAVPALHMEKAIRALPELFDDPFVLGGSYTSFVGEIKTIVPPRRMCDEAAEAFTELVPDAPRFDGTTTETQDSSLEKLTKWWKENSTKLTWDEKNGLLVRPK
jgi:hypothetical protein